MLIKAENVFLRKFEETLVEIREIPQNCCQAISKSAFSFDEITRLYCKEKSINPIPPSVDVLYFDLEKEEILFAEFTSFRAYCQRIGNSEDDTLLNFVIKELEGINLRDKIAFSLDLISRIVDEDNETLNLYVRKCLRKNILVMDLTYGEEVFLNIVNLEKLQLKCEGRFEGNITICSCGSFNQLLQAS